MFLASQSVPVFHQSHTSLTQIWLCTSKLSLWNIRMSVLATAIGRCNSFFVSVCVALASFYLFLLGDYTKCMTSALLPHEIKLSLNPSLTYATDFWEH